MKPAHESGSSGCLTITHLVAGLRASATTCVCISPPSGIDSESDFENAPTLRVARVVQYLLVSRDASQYSVTSRPVGHECGSESS